MLGVLVSPIDLNAEYILFVKSLNKINYIHLSLLTKINSHEKV